ncbi:polyketide synthase [Pseudozyma hubeiensis SY62]|uniref:Polyketide synthase n=1 Tax=Pseudozyma hubeiensis (strain SY62) TaxID=1305764 RepID=R9P1E3_PSEHS|nr:polyketide synthase [Pseudozyma hubeiensis SY62]GAC94989.1 polyketide synthase [Pseudozyma hubeiensis SY62]
MKAHGHKVVFLHASHRHILLPSTFKLLHVASRYDVVLKAFIDTAYRALRTEADVASHTISDGHFRRFALPDTFERLAEEASVQDLRSLPLTLTTLAQVAVVLASKLEFREALQGDIAAMWDPESHLSIAVLRSVDVSCRLELMATAIGAIKLAYWLDLYIQKSQLTGNRDARKRVSIHASQEHITAITAKCSANGIQVEETVSGIVIAIDKITHLETVLYDDDDDDAQRHRNNIATEMSLIPALTSGDCLLLWKNLQSSLLERNIKVSLKYDQGPSQQPGARDELVVDIAQLFSTLDFGRSQQQLKNASDLAQEQLAASRVHTPRIELALLGGTMRDEHARSAAEKFSSHMIAYVPLKLLDRLYPKDSHRYGDEPVPSSKVRGTPCQQIAIIGLSCKVPGANDADELWQLLKEGKSMCEEIPENLYRYQDYHSASYRERNVMRVKTGNFMASPGSVDKSILEEIANSGDCAKIDPQQRVAILTAYEALQKAGYGFSPYRRPDKPEQWSTHLAYCSDDYREHLSQNIEGDFVANTHRAHLVARLNETFGFRGEACTYDTACSSALVAVEAACNSLLSGETSAALTGGVNILTQPQITIGLDRGFFLSPSSQCMTLDDAGAGYSRADAVSIMLLKRLPDAVRDGDPILALISSAATNHSGESFSITHPHGPTQKRLYQAGMIASKTLPHDYSYIEMHGTGTQSGDFEEVSGIVQTFGQGKRGEATPLVLGSVKANIGHSEAASGASSMIKTVKIYEHGEVPRHIGIRTKLNTKLPPLDGLHVPLQETKLDRADTAFTLVDNFSAAGGNSSIVMDRGTAYRDRLLKMSEDALDVAAHSAHGSDDRHHLLFVTAATSFSLDAKRRRLMAFLDSNKDMSLTEFCSTVSLGDPMLPHRLIATPASIAEAKTCLCSQESVLINTGPLDRTRQSIGIVFSGQGAQYLDMARELYGQSPAFRRHVDNCNTIALSLQLPSLVEVIHPLRATLDASQTDSRSERKADTFNAVQYQLALIAVEVGLASMLLDWGLTPSCAAGHSLGEYAALWLAGVLSLRSLVELVGHRAMLMIELCAPNASTMLAIREGDGKVEQLLEACGNEQLEIACLNSPNDTVVAGPNEEIEKLRNFCEQSDPKIKAMAIPVPYAFHSKAVEPLMDEYRKVVAKHPFSKPMIPLASNLFGKVMTPDGNQIDGSYLVSHLRRQVLFSDSISDTQKQLVVDVWVEIGPHPTCTPMLKGCYAGSTPMPEFLSSFRKGSSSWTATLSLAKELASRGIDLRWDNVFADLGLRTRHHGLAEELPLYPFDLDECWVPFKDRGLRDHLVAASRQSDPWEGGRNSSEATHVASMRRPKPLHSLIWQSVKLEGTPPSAMFLARVSQRSFRDFIRGHVILGVPLAPATVFVELAQEAGMYWWQMDPCKQRPSSQSSEDVVIEVLGLSMVASLYLNENDSRQSIEITMQGNPTSNDGSIVQFFSHSEHQLQQHQYGSCRIRIISKEQVAREWARLRHLILRTVSTIKSQPACMIKTETIYKSFEAIVLYLGGFRGMNTIWMTEHGDEAVSEVSHHADAVDGRFLCSPMLLDSLGGLTGFISNVSFAEGPFVYMAEAIGRIVIMPAVGKIEPGSRTKLQVYARMEQDKELSKGSAYFFLPDGELMGSMENIAFKRIRRDMLSRLVQLSSRSFAGEAAKAAESSARHETLNVSHTAVRPQDSCGTASKTTTEIPPRTIPTTFLPAPGDQKAKSPMDELTNPDRRYTLSAPVHIGGPRSKRFDGQNILFVFPDGSGTAQSLPKLESVDSLSIYGFDSPYLGHTEAWSRGIAELIDRFVELLRSVQPQGPYKLAGWSIGGIFALEVARRLLSAGQEIAFVGFIDTPSPKQIQPLPADTLDEMLKPITSNTVREHFRSCALSLPDYRCLGLQPSERLPGKVVIVNARAESRLKGVIATEGDWRAFWLRSNNVSFHEVDGDHWSCLRPALELIVRSAQEQKS